MLKKIITIGGTVMILKDLADRIATTSICHDRALRKGKREGLTVGLAVGCTLGMAAGLLFAPKSGKETRRELGHKTSEAMKSIKEGASHVGHRVASEVEEKGSALLSRAEKLADTAKGTAEEKIEKTGEKTGAAVEAFKKQ